MEILKKPTAQWLYEFDSNLLGTVGGVSQVYLESFLKKVQRCIEILHGNGFFSPSQIVLSQWIVIKEEGKIDLEKEAQYIDIRSDQDIGFSDLVFNEIIKVHPLSEGVRPANIKINGVTQVASESKEENFLTINASFMGGGALEVFAFGDAWLPFSFDGKSTNMFYEKNANALEFSLKEIEKFLKVEPIFNDVSDLCEIDGYRLKNFTDGDGEIIGIDRFGVFS